MSDSHWMQAAVYAVVVAVSAVGYMLAQTAIDASRAKLPIMAYIDCLHKFETIVWPASAGEDLGLTVRPSGSEVCKDLSERLLVTD